VKIVGISANQNALLAMAAMFNFRSPPKIQAVYHNMISAQWLSCSPVVR